LTDAREGDITVITGKGSETSMALAGGKKIPWSDTRTVEELLQGRPD
jgi:UDP-N-acetylmuramyl tripeptide synthase